MGNIHDKPGKKGHKKHKGDGPIKIAFDQDAVIGTVELDSLWVSVGGTDAQQINTVDALNFANALVTQIHVIDPSLEIAAWQKENGNPTTISKLQFYTLFLQLNSKSSFPLPLTPQMREMQVNFFGESLAPQDTATSGAAVPVYPICLDKELRQIPFGTPENEPFNNKVVSAIHTRQKDHAPAIGYTISTIAILKEDMSSSQWRFNTLLATYSTIVHEQNYLCFLGRRPHHGENQWMAVFCYLSHKGTHCVALTAAGYQNWIDSGVVKDPVVPLSPKSEGGSDVSSGSLSHADSVPMWKDACEVTATESDSIVEPVHISIASENHATRPFPNMPGIIFTPGVNEPTRTASGEMSSSRGGNNEKRALSLSDGSNRIGNNEKRGLTLSDGSRTYLSTKANDKLRCSDGFGRTSDGGVRQDGLRASDGTPSFDDSQSLDGSRGASRSGADKSPKKARKRLKVEDKKDSKTKFKRSSSDDEAFKRSRDESRSGETPAAKGDNLLGIATHKLDKKNPPLDFSARCLKSISKRYPNAHFIQAEATPKLAQAFLEIDKSRSLNFDCLKVGILYCTPQTDIIEKIVTKKNVPSERFHQFLDALNIPEGKEGMSEVHYHNIKIGWMVGCKMDKDAIRSYIGNSPCLILFHDSTEPFDPSKLFLGQVTNFVCVVSPTATPNQWKVGFFVHYENKILKDGLAEQIKNQEELVLKHLCDFEPKIEIDKIYRKEEIFEFLVAKMFNSKFNFMRYHPVVKRMFEAPIAASLQSLVSSFAPDWYKEQSLKKK